MGKSEFINKIELELLSALFDYVVPALNKKIKIKPDQKQQGSLENIVNRKPKVNFEDIKELERLLSRNLNENVKLSKTRTIESYSLSLTRRKSNDEKIINSSISITYEENQNGEKLKVSVKKDEKEVYSAEIADLKDVKDKVIPYSVIINYEDKYGEERLSITYKQQLKNYLQKHIQDKEDMSSRVPLKLVNILPETVMGGVLGFTYIGDPSMGKRADLTGKTSRMVDIHESIHTPDEYETRVLTSWIMEKAKGKYVK